MSEIVHELKTLAPYWDAVDRGEKTFEVRRDDRGFQKGDVLRLYRTEDFAAVGWKTKPVIEKRIGYVLTGGQYGIEPGFVVLGLAAARVSDGNPSGAKTEGLRREAMTARPDEGEAEGGGRPSSLPLEQKP